MSPLPGSTQAQVPYSVRYPVRLSSGRRRRLHGDDLQPRARPPGLHMAEDGQEARRRSRRRGRRPIPLALPVFLEDPLDLCTHLVGAKTIPENLGCDGSAQWLQVSGWVFAVDLELPGQPLGRIGEEAGYGARVGGGLSGLLLNRAGPRVHQLHLLHLASDFSGSLDPPRLLERVDLVLNRAAGKAGGLGDLIRVGRTVLERGDDPVLRVQRGLLGTVCGGQVPRRGADHLIRERQGYVEWVG